MLNKIYIQNIINNALLEDINYTDAATDYLIPENQENTVFFLAKASGVLCGIDIAVEVFKTLQNDISYEILIKDGQRVKEGDIIARITGKTRTILKAERTSLNILQHLSGIATATDECVQIAKDTNASITDTRKTLPGLRGLEKYAVMVGGGKNHRFNLSDGAMLKDNHIDACGSITKAVSTLREKLGHMIKIEVEVRNKEELLEALETKADVIMLDNMTADEMKECVAITNKRAVLEASGGITRENLRDTALTGVDVISIGALTHSVKAFDISLKIEN